MPEIAPAEITITVVAIAVGIAAVTAVEIVAMIVGGDRKRF